MSYRWNTAKPTVALWILVALGDLVLILASGGVLAAIMLVGMVAVAVAAVGAWSLRRGSDRGAVSTRVAGSTVTRRRA